MKVIVLLVSMVIYGSTAIGFVDRFSFSNKTDSLVIEVLEDDIFHFYYSSLNQVWNPTSPLPTSPYIIKKDFPGPKTIHKTDQGFETSHYSASINELTLCLTVKDILKNLVLTTLCPNGPGQFTLSKEQTKNIYGLGEQFRNPGSANGDWMNDIRSSPLPEGNTLEDFQGGAVGNALFPILYALGERTNNYALFVDHVQNQKWNFKDQPWSIQTSGDPVGFYFLGGEDLPKLRLEFMDLVGHPLVPPKKAFGFWLSEFGYKSWAEMENKLKTLRRNHFPIDGFVLDVFWCGEFESDNKHNHIGSMSFDQKLFPDPQFHIEDFNKRGVGIMLHEDPFINNWLDGFSEMKNNAGLVTECEGCPPKVLSNYLGDIGIIDWTNDMSAQFWHLSKRLPLIQLGVTFHWTDFAEMDGYGGQDWYHGVNPGEHSAMENHNLFSFKWAESIAKGYEKLSQRQFILSRSGTPGVQRFGAALWSGDIGSNMKSLASHLNAHMNLSLSGIDYFGSDIGGYHREALQGDIDDVYTKWLAHSTAFDVPVRPHTNNWEKIYQTAPDRIGDFVSNKKNIRLRYELAPYYYSLAYRAYLFGEPVIPPLFYYFQSDPNIRLLGDEKMIGPYILVAAAPLDGPISKNVYIPSGKWIDYRNQKTFESSGESFKFQFGNEDHFELPFLVREGAIIPTALVDDKTMNILGQRQDGSKDTALRMKIYPSNNSTSFTIYDDDGLTSGYLAGHFSQTVVTQAKYLNKVEIKIGSSQGSYDGASDQRNLELSVFSAGAKEVTVNDLPLMSYKTKNDFQKGKSGFFQSPKNLLFIKTLPLSTRQEQKIAILD